MIGGFLLSVLLLDGFWFLYAVVKNQQVYRAIKAEQTIFSVRQRDGCKMSFSIMEIGFKMAHLY